MLFVQVHRHLGPSTCTSATARPEDVASFSVSARVLRSCVDFHTQEALCCATFQTASPVPHRTTALTILRFLHFFFLVIFKLQHLRFRGSISRRSSGWPMHLLLWSSFTSSVSLTASTSSPAHHHGLRATATDSLGS